MTTRRGAPGGWGEDLGVINQAHTHVPQALVGNVRDECVVCDTVATHINL